MFSRRHYEFLAEFFKENLEFNPDMKLADVVETLADELKRDNSGFKKERFLKAAGIEE